MAVALREVLAEPLSTSAAIPLPQKTALPLNEFQLKVLRWIADGKRNEEIADILGSNCNIVQRVCCEAMDALGSPTRAGAVAAALRRKLIT